MTIVVQMSKFLRLQKHVTLSQRAVTNGPFSAPGPHRLNRVSPTLSNDLDTMSAIKPRLKQRQKALNSEKETLAHGRLPTGATELSWTETLSALVNSGTLVLIRATDLMINKIELEIHSFLTKSKLAELSQPLLCPILTDLKPIVPKFAQMPEFSKFAKKSNLVLEPLLIPKLLFVVLPVLGAHFQNGPNVIIVAEVNNGDGNRTLVKKTVTRSNSTMSLALVVVQPLGPNSVNGQTLALPNIQQLALTKPCTENDTTSVANLTFRLIT